MTSTISTLTVLGFIAVAAAWLPALFIVIRNTLQSWTKLKRAQRDERESA